MGLQERSVSESSDDIDIRPLELGDLKRRLEDSPHENSLTDILKNGSGNRYFSSVMGIKRKKGTSLNTKSELVKTAWKNAVRKARSLGDPWEKFHLDEHRTERAKRHRFHALKNCWVVDEVVIKMEKEPFNNGAMRECFRMKKLSNFAKRDDWSRAHNYVAKRYMSEDVPGKTYFEDVRLQVDIFQMAVLEMIERPGNPLYHVEHFIEGKYVKYNSNSGFVRSEALRMTPQAFSHFTFERSGHELIVVDIQGVGDLYTDPQIHTCSGSDYGDGNLGTRGMALFFHSHICNSICKSLGLTQFDLAPSEVEACRKISSAQKLCKTIVRGTEEHVILPTAVEKENIQECIRLRSISSGYLSAEEKGLIDSIVGSSGESMDSVDSFDDLNPQVVVSENEDSGVDSSRRQRFVQRLRQDSVNDFGESTETIESNLKTFDEMIKRKARPSHVYGEVEHQLMLNSLSKENPQEEAEAEAEAQVEQSILGKVHLDLANYHELNRFVEENESYDREAAMFHLKIAAKCGNLDSILAMAHIHLGMPHDILPDIELPEDKRDYATGFQFLLLAANSSDRGAVIKIANAYDSGIGLPPQMSVNWVEAIKYYERAVEMNSVTDDGNDCSGTMDDPIYQLVARQAHLYWKGGNGLEKDANKAGY
ncbi:Eukaryotic elongation factor 2 kinase [Armadillidium nasatum]|uniref:Eukaryotic elongation factor 2 kinase n=1 Tax=Armadillidium nasatum TaxID=96803 RepID=A0A5N5TC41_9CRUS|nr:Eukaryotic elongation factor 2 kinase [Armadillidium nasatum]